MSCSSTAGMVQHGPARSMEWEAWEEISVLLLLVLQVTKCYHVLHKMGCTSLLIPQCSHCISVLTVSSLPIPSFLSSLLPQPSSEFPFFVFSLQKTLSWHDERLVGSALSRVLLPEEAKAGAAALQQYFSYVTAVIRVWHVMLTHRVFQIHCWSKRN